MVIQAEPGVPAIVESDCGNTNPCSWLEARLYCANLTVGDSGQKGWRLLYIQELAALVDKNSKSCTLEAGSLCLPDGHPFKNVQSFDYWSASTVVDFTPNAWVVYFDSGGVFSNNKDNGREGNGNYAWCGHGARPADAY